MQVICGTYINCGCIMYDGHSHLSGHTTIFISASATLQVTQSYNIDSLCVERLHCHQKIHNKLIMVRIQTIDRSDWRFDKHLESSEKFQNEIGIVDDPDGKDACWVSGEIKADQEKR